MDQLLFEIPDDSGFLALVDPDAYEAFVNEDWGFDKLFAHFKNQMQEQRLLIWGTGAEELWRVQVRFSTSAVHGYREVDGSLVVTNNRLLLTNYDELTIAAQFQEIILPEPQPADSVISIPTGAYHCRIIQTTDPIIERACNTSVVCDFVVEIVSMTGVLPVWTAVPWAAV
jgi:hypothetical protein